jgi:hypothetical protein
LLDSYVARFPTGENLDDILWLRIRHFCDKAFDEQCRKAAHTFLGKFPGDGRADIAIAVTNTD